MDKSPEKTFTEQIDSIRQYVIDKVNFPNEDKNKIYDRYRKDVDHPELQASFNAYHQASTQGGLKGTFTNQHKLLSKHLAEFDVIATTAKLGDRNLAERFRDDMKTHYKFDAQQLLNGNKLGYNDYSVAEARQLRNDLEKSNSQLKQVSGEFTKLKEKFSVVIKHYNNIISNLKGKGYSEEQINDLHKDPPKEKQLDRGQENQKPKDKGLSH